MQNQTLIVDRNDPSDIAIVNTDIGPLADDHIRVEIGPFALTANNITYMVTGDLIGYWKYFDPAHYGIDEPKMGRMPVWGYGRITESRCDGLAVGTKIYGFFPVAKSIDMKPVKMSQASFQDGITHRAPLHSVYNGYSIVDADPSFGAHETLQPVLRPLFTTSFLLDDFMADNEFFGAEQIILLSASSKTALGTAYCLSKRGGMTVTGLTSSSNMEFVKATGFYDHVQSYDAIAALDPTVKTAFIDMAGNGSVMGRLYEHYEDNVVYNCMVGKSHWQGGAPPKLTKGSPAVMFFAPDQVKKRVSDWGPDGFAKNLAERWLPFCESAKDWLDVKTHDGIETLLPVYKDLLNGKASPAKSDLFKL